MFSLSCRINFFVASLVGWLAALVLEMGFDGMEQRYGVVLDFYLCCILKNDFGETKWVIQLFIFRNQ